MIPVRISASVDMVPWVSFVSIAFEVPTAWADVPSASPIAISSSSLNVLTRMGDIAAPIIPVRITMHTVIIGIPLRLIEMSWAIAVVTDLGVKLAMILGSRFSEKARTPSVTA